MSLAIVIENSFRSSNGRALGAFFEPRKISVLLIRVRQVCLIVGQAGLQGLAKNAWIANDKGSYVVLKRLRAGGTRRKDSEMRFRHTAGFGKRIEYWIIGRMLKEGLDVYVPLVDDDAIDAVIRRADGSFVTVQIKARSSDVIEGDGALFAAITTELRENYWFVFYSELMNSTWIMSSQEFISEAVQNKSGKNAGKRSIWFNGKRKDRVTGRMIEACKPQFEKYLATDFSRLAELPTPRVAPVGAS